MFSVLLTYAVQVLRLYVTCMVLHCHVQVLVLVNFLELLGLDVKIRV